MKKLYKFLLLPALAVTFVIFTSELLYHSGSPGGKTGSPGDGGNNCTGCHSGTPIAQEYWITSSMIVSGYSPGQTYDVFVAGIDPGAEKFGFEATAEDNTNAKVGTFTASFGGFTQTINGSKAITHTALGSIPFSDTATAWYFTWTAPSSLVGDVTFYAAINAANGNGGTSGDQIYLTELTVSPAVGVDENAGKPFSVYPNPSEGIVFVEQANEIQDQSIEVINLNGQVVYNQPSFSQKTRLDLSDLNEGVYLLRIGNVSQRIVVR
jgi:hypothetical protein